MNRACLIHSTENFAALPTLCEQARSHGLIPYILCDEQNHQALVQWSVGREIPSTILDISGDLTAPLYGYDEVVFLPDSSQISFDFFRKLSPLYGSLTLQPLFPPMPSHGSQTVETVPSWIGWRATHDLALRILREPATLHFSPLQLFDRIQHWSDPPRWQSIPLSTSSDENPLSSKPSILSTTSSVLAVISFHRCEEWLHACLTSLVQQSRPPDHIVVVDDSSPALPIALLEAFPDVTLLSTTRNIGPEKILNNIIKATDYDAYMVQDADDWSAYDRLELSLRAAERTGAEFIGTHEFRLNQEKTQIELCRYPADVNQAMAQSPGHYLLHCTSLIARSLAMRIGGFNESLRLAADTDFVHRAWPQGSIVNLPAFSYFRRVRPGSLTTEPATGQKSAARTIEHRFITIRAKRNLELIRTGQVPDVFVQQREAIDFYYHQGPPLRLQKDVQFLDRAN